MLRGECDMVHVERKPVSDLQRGDQWARRRGDTRRGWVDGRLAGGTRRASAALDPCLLVERPRTRGRAARAQPP